MRKAIIAGNWKMNKTPEEAAKLVEELKPLVKDANCDVVVCPPFVCLDAVQKAAAGSNVKVGAQNCYFKDSGAYTGEVAPAMLEAMGVEYVIIGHSERREYFNETDDSVNKKVKLALQHNLIPIVCCGEYLEQREAGVTKTLVQYQMQAALSGLTKEQVKSLVIAYEPIWAIGTGKTATDEDANEVIGFIRKQVEEDFGKETADAVRIQYGGSMKPNNVVGLMAQDEIDGGLVGGASLNAEDFAAIVNYDK
ncbi:MAG: triose-phosphate isomerase [Eubacteriales bacterium]